MTLRSWMLLFVSAVWWMCSTLAFALGTSHTTRSLWSKPCRRESGYLTADRSWHTKYRNFSQAVLQQAQSQGSAFLGSPWFSQSLGKCVCVLTPHESWSVCGTGWERGGKMIRCDKTTGESCRRTWRSMWLDTFIQLLFFPKTHSLRTSKAIQKQKEAKVAVHHQCLSLNINRD